MLRPPAALASLVVVVLLTACGGGSTSEEAGPTPTSEFAPTGEPSDLTPTTTDGQTVVLDGAGTIVMPEGSTSDGPEGIGTGMLQLLHLMPDAGDEGVPAVQVTWGLDDTRVYVQSWMTEQEAQSSPDVSDYVRSAVQWPGSVESVVATWTQEAPLDSGEIAAVDAVRLTVQTHDGVTVAVIALAREGELEGSAAMESLRSLTLD